MTRERRHRWTLTVYDHCTRPVHGGLVYKRSVTSSYIEARPASDVPLYNCPALHSMEAAMVVQTAVADSACMTALPAASLPGMVSLSLDQS